MQKNYEMLNDELLKAILGISEEQGEVTDETVSKEAPRYPLTNLSTDDAETLFIEIACAGFAKENIQVEIVDGYGLHIHGAWDDADVEQEGDFTYIQQHISQRDFLRKIHLNESYQTDDIVVEYDNGLLLIIIPKVQPEIIEPQRKFVQF